MTTTVERPAAAGEDVAVEHPVAVLVRRLSTRLDDVVTGRPVWAMTPAEQTHTLTTLAKVTAQLDALRLQVLVEAERSGATTEEGAATAADWMTATTQQRRSIARAELRLADSLCRHRHLEAGMLAGTVSLDQAHVIKRALERLPQTGPFAVTCDQVETAEEHLVGLCSEFDPAALEVLGQKVFEVIAPDIAEAAEEAQLAAQEERAARRKSLRTWRDGEGVTHGKFSIPDLHGDMLRKMIDSLASPLRHRADGEVVSTSSTSAGDDGVVSTSSTIEARSTSDDDSSVEPVETTGSRATGEEPVRVPTEQRRGEAFCELIERMSAADLPTTSGGDATVVVSMTEDQLHNDLDTAGVGAGVATLDTGTRISAGEARRLACLHRLLPAVLAGASQVLDLGMSARLFSKAQRLALHVRDGGCTAEGCDMPPAMCHAHHDQPWSHGGPTDLANARLLCPRHHRRVHDPRFDHDIGPDNEIRFYRRV